LTQATPSDIKEITEILNVYVSFGLSNEDIITDLIENHKVIISIIDNKIVGVLTLFIHHNYTEFQNIVTLPEYRGKGIASKLLSLAVLESNELYPIKGIGWVQPNGWDAENIILKQGFEIVKEDKEYWKIVCDKHPLCPHRTNKCNCSCKMVERTNQR
jgi:N-acetylglutamate synthase-like GNAT family acetyltransferase